MTDKNFLTAQDMADTLGVSKSYVYKVVRQLNADMEAPILTIFEKKD